MSSLLKIAASLSLLASLTACTVVPAQVGYEGPAVGVVAVRPAPYYAAPAPYYAAPAPYYGPRPYYYRGYGYGPGYRYRRW